MACEITYKNGNPVGKTYPSLMRSILVATDFNEEKALELYGVTMLDEFKDLGIKNPDLQNILNFIEEDNKNNLTDLNKTDKQLLLDISLQDKTINNIKSRFLEAFNINGVFGINENKLRESGLFSEGDIMFLKDTQSTADIQSLYYKLSETNAQVDPVETDVIIRTNDGLKKYNPDLFVQNALNFYIGLKTESEVLEKAQEVGDTLIEDNPSLASEVLKVVANKRSLVQYETDEYSENVVPKTKNNSLTKLEQTFDLSQDFTPFLSQLEFLRRQSPQVYARNLPLISEYVSNLVNQAQDLGLDLNGLENIYDNKTYAQLQDLWDSLFNFLVDAQNSEPAIRESMEEYISVKNDFFETSPESSQTWTEENKTDSDSTLLHLETNQSEEVLYRNHRIVRLYDNVYQKVQSLSLSSLYDMIFRNPSLVPLTIKPTELNKDLAIQEIDAHVTELSKQSLREDSDIDTLKIVQAYKIILGSREDQKNPITGDLRLNPQNFLIEFNKKILKDTLLQDIFYISNRGLESKQILGDYTLRQLENNLSDTQFRDLVKYAKLSGNESLIPLTAYHNDYNNSVATRDYLANNLKEIPQYKNDFYRDNGYIVTDSEQDFIKIDSELYENVSPYIYAKVDRDSRYLNSNLKKPSYDGSVTPNIKHQEGGEMKVNKENIKEQNNIEFC